MITKILNISITTCRYRLQTIIKDSIIYKTGYCFFMSETIYVLLISVAMLVVYIRKVFTFASTKSFYV